MGHGLHWHVHAFFAAHVVASCGQQGDLVHAPVARAPGFPISCLRRRHLICSCRNAIQGLVFCTKESAQVFGTTVSGHCSMYRYVLFQHVQHLHVSNGSVRACTCQRFSRFLHSIRKFVKAKCAVECNRGVWCHEPNQSGCGYAYDQNQ